MTTSEKEQIKAIGIDLGTTYSAIAYLDNDGRPNTIANSEGELTTPSVVFFDRDGIIVGTEGRFAGESEPERLAKLAKRDMGGAKYRKKILGQDLPPEVIQSVVLRRLKDDAELKLGDITKAVVTVPAYFNEPRRRATLDSGSLAGLEVIDIINEPTAAALAYGVQQGFLSDKAESKQKELVLVYDLGGGTFDVTLMEIDGANFGALATAGDVYLGGVDFDQRIFEHASEQIADQHQVSVDGDPRLAERLMEQCTRAKKALTARKETVIRIENEGQRFKIDITREQFEGMTQDLLERTRFTTDRVLREADKSWKDLTKLLLVGGSTRMPMVPAMLEKESGLKVDRSLSPDEAVAHGAAIYAGILLNHGASAGKGISVQNVNSHDLGVLGIQPKTKEPRRQIVIPRNRALPAKEKKRFVTARDGQSKIMVKIVEGGTDDGQGSTMIGKCSVENLPADIKKGTSVDVTFSYETSGTISVVAEVPSLELKAESAIARSAGMSESDLGSWQKRVAEGLVLADVTEEVPSLPALEPSVDAPVFAPDDEIVPAVVAQPAGEVPAVPIPPAVAKVPEVPALAPAAQKMPAAKKPATNPTAAEKPVAKKPVAKAPAAPAAPVAKVENDSPVIAPLDIPDAKPKQEVSSLNLDLGDAAPTIAADSAEFGNFLAENSEAKEAGESILDILGEGDDKKAEESDSQLGNFLKGMG